jgi:hypothetical protein
MRRLALLTLAAAAPLVGAALAAPEWAERAGLDVWNVGEYRRILRDSEARGEELEEVAEAGRHRNAVIDQASRRLCSGGLTLSQAVSEVLAVCSPEWLALARTYAPAGGLPAGASDRDVAAQLLLAWIEGMRREAEKEGDATAAGEIAARLDCLGKEARALAEAPGPAGSTGR